jgi:hypothetical protein
MTILSLVLEVVAALAAFACRWDAKEIAIFSNCATGYLEPLFLKVIDDGLIRKRVLGVFFSDERPERAFDLLVRDGVGSV